MPSDPMNTVEQVAPVSDEVIAGFTPGPRPGSVSVDAASPWTVAVPAGPRPGGDAACAPADGAWSIATLVAIATVAARARRTVRMGRSHHGRDRAGCDLLHFVRV